METIQKYLKNFFSFRTRFLADENGIHKELLRKQSPTAIVITCCDSRVDPAILFGCKLGEIFVHRNIANLIPPIQSIGDGDDATIATIEYAVEHLHVQDIILMGHSHCGGIHGLIEYNHAETNDEQESYVSKWIQLAQPAYQTTVKKLGANINSAFYRECEKNAVVMSTENLLNYPLIKQYTACQKLHVHTLFYDMEHCELFMYQHSQKSWINLVNKDENYTE